MKPKEFRDFTTLHPKIYRRKNGFVYAQSRLPMNNKIILETIQALRVPESYKTLWVDTDPNHSLRVIALDSQGRKQYFYSPEWVYLRNARKIEMMHRFALGLPRLLERIKKDTASHRDAHDHREFTASSSQGPFSKNRVIAFMLRIMQLTNIRIGNKKYYDKYESHGLCTLQKRHVKIKRKGLEEMVVFEFLGKHHQENLGCVTDPSVVQFIKSLLRLHQHDDNWLFVFQQSVPNGQFYQVSAQMVNDYLHMDPKLSDITCKDFRTLNANIIFLKILREKPIDPKNTSKIVQEAMEETSQHLCNTANVCKNSYVGKVIVDIYREDPARVKNLFILDILALAVAKIRKLEKTMKK